MRTWAYRRRQHQQKTNWNITIITIIIAVCTLWTCDSFFLRLSFLCCVVLCQNNWICPFSLEFYFVWFAHQSFAATYEFLRRVWLCASLLIWVLNVFFPSCVVVFETPSRALYSTNSKRGWCNWVQTVRSFSHQNPLQAGKMEILNHQKLKVITFHWHVCAKNVHIHDNAFKMSSYQILHNVKWCWNATFILINASKVLSTKISTHKPKQSKIPTRISDSLQKKYT